MEKDAYRKQVRELGERCDELQLQLFQKESQLLAMEAKLRLEPHALVGLQGTPLPSWALTGSASPLQPLTLPAFGHCLSPAAACNPWVQTGCSWLGVQASSP